MCNLIILDAYVIAMKQNNTRAFVILTSLFFTWGLITVLVDSLVPRLREIFSIGNFEASLVQFAFFIAYGLFSIPAGSLLKKIGYKKGIILGLLTMGIGCLLFYPAASLRMFPLFLLGYFTLAGGMTILQVAANPYVAVLGHPDGASSRLNLSQAFNSLGTAIAPVLGAIFILSDTILTSSDISTLSEVEKANYYVQEAAAVQTPFVILALLLLLLGGIVAMVKLPKILGETSGGSYREVIKNKKLLFGAIGIFVYVGTEVAIGTFLTNYFLDMNLATLIKENEFMRSVFVLVHSGDIDQIDKKGIVGAFVVFYWSGAMVGRFIGAYLTRVFVPGRVLSVFGVLAIALVILSMSTTGFVSMWAIIATGLFNSIMFPTIFTIAISDLGDLKPQGSGVLCTAIAGGAFIPPLYGFFADTAGFKYAFILIILCYSYIMMYGNIHRKKGQPGVVITNRV